jgi:hypothetical protein
MLDLLIDPSPWDLAIFHPTCTYLCNSGVQWLEGNRQRWKNMVEGAKFFRKLLDCNVPKIAVENPIPHKYALKIIGRKYDQIIKPEQFGHREMKKTCLWLKGLPLLVETDNVGPPPKDKRERAKWARVHRASPGPDRWKERSRTLQGHADAYALQWGGDIRGLVQ